MNRPEKTEYDAYYEGYVSRVPEDDILAVLAQQPEELKDRFSTIDEERGTYAYADGKWSIKQVLGHVIDAERVFMYRLYRISRADQTPIEGFEQDTYIQHGRANERSYADMLDEFALLRRANLYLIRHFNDEDWRRFGTANNLRISVRALVYIMAGHVRHHLEVLKERYLANETASGQSTI